MGGEGPSPHRVVVQIAPTLAYSVPGSGLLESIGARASSQGQADRGVRVCWDP